MAGSFYSSEVLNAYSELIWGCSVIIGADTIHICSFCDEDTTNPVHPKHGWHTCDTNACQLAEAAQVERLYAGLVDCPETRRDALRWAERKCSELLQR